MKALGADYDLVDGERLPLPIKVCCALVSLPSTLGGCCLRGERLPLPIKVCYNRDKASRPAWPAR